MAAVHLGRLRAPAGFARTVAIKQLHAHLAKDPDFVAMFLDEARLVARIRHPNVVSTLDVVVEGSTVLLVMEYVHGEALSKLIRAAKARNELIPPAIVVAILSQMLLGLHAAHEATSEQGAPLHIVHRDVSPQNVLVGVDGNARVLDFGIAQAVTRAHSTQDGQIKGKIAYMAPEQVRGEDLDRRADVFAAGVLLWEALTTSRLFENDSPTRLMTDVLTKPIPPPSTLVPGISAELDAVVMRALEREPGSRWKDAHAMATALEDAVRPATAREVSAWVDSVAHDALAKRAALVTAIESGAPLGNAAADAPTAPGVDTQSDAPRRVDTVVSNVTEMPITGAARTRMRSRAPILLGAVVVAAGVSAFAWPRAHEKNAAPQQVVVSTPTETTTTAPQAIPEAITTATAQVHEAVVSSARPLPPSRFVPRTSHTPSGAPQSPPSAGPDCNPPYSIEADGTHRFKPECVHYRR